MTAQDASASTRETVEQLLRCLAAGDLDGVAALYADRVDWSLDWPPGPLSDAVPWIRDRTTRSDVRQHFATIAAHNSPSGQGTTIEGVVVTDLDAFVTGTIRNQSTRTGRHYAARFALHLRVADRQIVQHHVYEDSLAVHTACTA